MARIVLAPRLKQTRAGTYFIAFHNGVEPDKHFLKTRDKAEAERGFAAWSEKRARMTKSGDTLTIGELWESKYDDLLRKRARCASDILGQWKIHLEPYFGKMLVADCTATVVAKFLSDKRAGRCNVAYQDDRETRFKKDSYRPSQNQVNKLQKYFFSILNHAASEGRISKDAVPSLSKMQRVPFKRMKKAKYWRRDEYDRLLALSETLSPPEGEGKLHPLHLFLWIALLTGVRREALIMTRGEMVDFHEKLIRWFDFYTDESGTDFLATNAETSGKHFVNAPFRERLGELLARAVREAGERGDGRAPDDYLFKVRNQKYIDRRHALFCKKIGVRYFSVHSCRHTFASLLILKGASAEHVAKLLGNTPEMVRSTYDHIFASDLRETLDLIPEPARPADATVIPMRRKQ